jgi:hypothetical protein
VVDGGGERLVFRVDGEGPALQHEPEVADPQEARQELAAEYLTWASSNFLEKKPRGSQPQRPRPLLMCVAEASTARLGFATWAGYASQVAEASICLTSVKAPSLSPFHSTALGPFGPPPQAVCERLQRPGGPWQKSL